MTKIKKIFKKNMLYLKVLIWKMREVTFQSFKEGSLLKK